MASAWTRPVKLDTNSLSPVARRDDKAGDRLHRGQRVLDAVIELFDQQALRSLRLLALGDVARHLGGADHLARWVAQRRHAERYVDAAAVLGDAYRLVVLARARRAVARPGSVSLRPCSPAGMIRVIDCPIISLGLVAEDPRGARVPRGDPALERLADDGVVRRRDNGCQSSRFDRRPSVRSRSTSRLTAPVTRPDASFRGVGNGRNGTRVPSGLSATASHAAYRPPFLQGYAPSGIRHAAAADHPAE